MTIASRIRSALGKTRQPGRDEAYLNEATSLVDLELRQREIDRGRFGRR